jgi:para-nitrobenzyl esterase
LQIVTSLASDAYFVCPGTEYARALTEQGVATYMYEFSWAATDAVLGACHCIDLPFVFGTFDAFAGGNMLGAARHASVGQLAEAVQSAWIAFIRRGSPELPSGAPWHPMQGESINAHRFRIYSSSLAGSRAQITRHLFLGGR